MIHILRGDEFNKNILFIFMMMMGLNSCLITPESQLAKNKTSYGYLEGKISIGPLCPVETNPPDSACLPTPETYQTWATAVYTGNFAIKLFTIVPDQSGYFLDSLQEGNYRIDFDRSRDISPGGSNLPIDVKIIAGDTTRVAIHIDTGIR